ncbi:hypothetical protein [Jannaschia formosa]|uniref:hypothetical protein n=1 Tax=Jannaschia formosa TaxID=2259592 RepID=UPI000E1B760A|nr:hypothetical protein [Jannaschia formosa]TFL18884.1 hypothetical protein DR046_08175 [Jannaschia formosa]
MRATHPLLALAALTLLAACDPPVPDSAVTRGPGFETPAQIAQRDSALRGGSPTPSQTIRPPEAPPGPVVVAGGPVAPQTEAERLAADTRAALGVPAPQPPVSGPFTDTPQDFATAPLPAQIPGPAPFPQASPAPNPIELDRNNPGISREQDFAAVASQRSIEADAARVNAARQQFEMIQPRELERPGEVGPNIVSYALNQARPVGASGSFRRSLTASERAANRRCANYRTPDVAQEEFLSAGGPERDRLGLDPDGDGNACAWDPAAFRNLVRN